MLRRARLGAAEWLRAVPAEARARRRLVGLLPAAGGPLLAGLVLAFAVLAALPATGALVVGALVQRLVNVLHTQPGAGIAAVVPPVLALGAVLLADQLVAALREPLGFAAVRRIDGHVRHRVRTAATAPDGIEHLERADVQNDISLAAGGWPGYTTGDGAVGQLWLAFRFLSAGAAAAVLAGFSVPLAVALFALMVTLRAVLRRQYLALTGIMAARWGEIRRADYAGEVAAGLAAAKEVRIFGIGSWLVRRRQDDKLAAYQDVWRFRRRVMLRQPIVFALTVVAALLALVAPAVAALSGRIGPGELAEALRAAMGVFAIGGMGAEALSIEYSRPALDALDRLVRQVGPGRPPTAPAPGTAGSPPHIRFERVGFCYQGTDRTVLCGLDLEVRPGEVLALVGLNGAGKTTLTKLLAGLYRPDEGRILVDDADLATVDVRAWRRRLAVVFQDFVRYELPARDNVRLGAYGHDGGEPELHAAAERAGMLPLVRDLPLGWDTPLSRAYLGGTDLSGGQWQRVALARALFALRAGRQVLVLDEPTAHLDVRAEQDVFDRVVGEATGAAAPARASIVLISHRLATVRRADRIVLLSGGAVVEQGTHEQLMNLDGRYADLFAVQAARFR